MLGVEFLAVLHSAEETRPQQEVERVLMQILHPGIHAAARELTILTSILKKIENHVSSLLQSRFELSDLKLRRQKGQLRY